MDQQNTKMYQRWFRDVPMLLTNLVQAIEQMKDVAQTFDNPQKVERFENTLIKLRNNYKTIKSCLNSDKNSFDRFTESQNIIRDMCSLINSWFRSTNIAVGINVEWDHRYTGNALIPLQYTLLISNSFDVTCNRI